MKKYYDVVVNFDEYLYYFYEWEECELDYIRRIPMIKVSKKVFKEILNNKIKIDDEEYENIKNKMLFSNNRRSSGFIITDGDNAIAMEFVEGVEVAVSTLELKDELNVLDKMYQENNYDLKYSVVNRRKYHAISKKDEYVKKYLSIWIKDLCNSNNVDKISFYYREWFKKKLSDVHNAYKEMSKDLNSGLKEIHYYIYELSLLEHKKSGLSS